ncbi:glutathione S-transferase family protein [Stutzerimonas azotifigens]|uniref:glutathione S-transferase family protein n=1 Tax=Stutzerimonas azotifigens TaxID=291995 RepID=UPI0004232166|nr:glutathione S-transferase [Stutzerimonas azotifigens]
MLKLHGFCVSNYYNMAKLVLLEKRVPFEEVEAVPDGSPAFLARSPRGKVPFLETDEGFLNETGAILEYLEQLYPEPALLPAEPFARARVRALMKAIELYVELSARLGYPEAFFGTPVAPPLRERCRDELLAGVDALARHAAFAPFVAGERFTLADVYFLYSFDLAKGVARALFDEDLSARLPGARALLQRLGENPNVQRIAADREAAMAAYLARKRAGR